MRICVTDVVVSFASRSLCCTSERKTVKGLNPGVISFISRSSVIVRVNVVLKLGILMTVTDFLTTC